MPVTSKLATVQEPGGSGWRKLEGGRGHAGSNHCLAASRPRMRMALAWISFTRTSVIVDAFLHRKDYAAARQYPPL